MISRKCRHFRANFFGVRSTLISVSKNLKIKEIYFFYPFDFYQHCVIPLKGRLVKLQKKDMGKTSMSSDKNIPKTWDTSTKCHINSNASIMTNVSAKNNLAAWRLNLLLDPKSMVSNVTVSNVTVCPEVIFAPL